MGQVSSSTSDNMTEIKNNLDNIQIVDVRNEQQRKSYCMRLSELCLIQKKQKSGKTILVYNQNLQKYQNVPVLVGVNDNALFKQRRKQMLIFKTGSQNIS